MHPFSRPGCPYRYRCYRKFFQNSEYDLIVTCLLQGGVAAVAAPVMGPVSDAIVSTLGDTILVEMGMHVGFDLTAKAANDLILDKAIKEVFPIHSKRLETTSVKTMLITLKYKHTIEDAALGFYRSSLHRSVDIPVEEPLTHRNVCNLQRQLAVRLCERLSSYRERVVLPLPLREWSTTNSPSQYEARCCVLSRSILIRHVPYRPERNL